MLKAKFIDEESKVKKEFKTIENTIVDTGKTVIKELQTVEKKVEDEIKTLKAKVTKKKK